MIKHRNNIGLLRLLFASLVIVGHAPELIDGNRHREPLTAVFHSVSLGELCVDAFFLLSGFLITQSLLNTRSYLAYFERRICRIWPGYIVACLICSFVLAPLVGGHPFSVGPRAYAKMLFLMGALDTPGQLAGLPYPYLNGAMWTISFEFGCYVMVAVLGLIGALQRPSLVATFAAVALSLITLDSFVPFRKISIGWPHHYYLFGDPMRLAGFFLIGTLAFMRRDWLMDKVKGKIAGGAAIAMVVSLLSPHTAQIGLALFGGISLHWLSFKANFGLAQQINDKWDVSYGTYLYGWPLAIAWLYFGHVTSPLVLIVPVLPVAWLAGAASWWLVEKRAKDILRSRTEQKIAARDA